MPSKKQNSNRRVVRSGGTEDDALPGSTPSKPDDEPIEEGRNRGWSPKKPNKRSAAIETNRDERAAEKTEKVQTTEEYGKVSTTEEAEMGLEEFMKITKRFVASLVTKQEKERAMTSVVRAFGMKPEEILLITAEVVKQDQEAALKPALAPPTEAPIVKKRTPAKENKKSATDAEEGKSNKVEASQASRKKKTPPPPPMSIEEVTSKGNPSRKEPVAADDSRTKQSRSAALTKNADADDDDEDEVVLMTPSESTETPGLVTTTAPVENSSADKSSRVASAAVSAARPPVSESSIDKKQPKVNNPSTSAKSNGAHSPSPTSTASNDRTSSSGSPGPSQRDQLLAPVGLSEQHPQPRQVGVIGSPASVPAPNNQQGSSSSFSTAAGFPSALQAPNTASSNPRPNPPGYGAAHPALPGISSAAGLGAVDPGFSPFQSDSPFLSHNNSAVATPSGGAVVGQQQNAAGRQRSTPPAIQQQHLDQGHSRSSHPPSSSHHTPPSTPPAASPPRRFPGPMPCGPDEFVSYPPWSLLKLETRDLDSNPYEPLEHPFDRNLHGQTFHNDAQLAMFTAETDPNDFVPELVFTASDFIRKQMSLPEVQHDVDFLEYWCRYARKLTCRTGDSCLSFDQETGAMNLREISCRIALPLLHAGYLSVKGVRQELLWCIHNLVLLPVPGSYAEDCLNCPTFHSPSFFESSDFATKSSSNKNLLQNLIPLLLLEEAVRTQAFATLAAVLIRHPEVRRKALDVYVTCHEREVGQYLGSWRKLMLGGSRLPYGWSKERIETIFSQNGRDALDGKDRRVRFSLTDILIAVVSTPTWPTDTDREKAALSLSLLLVDGAQDPLPPLDHSSSSLHPSRVLVTQRHDEDFLAALCVQLESSSDLDTLFTSLLGLWKMIQLTKGTEEEKRVHQDVLSKMLLPRLPTLLENMQRGYSPLDSPQRASDVLTLLFNIVFPLIVEDKRRGADKTPSPARGVSPVGATPPGGLAPPAGIPGLPPPQSMGSSQRATGAEGLLGRAPYEREADALFLLVCKVLTNVNLQSQFVSNDLRSNRYGISALEDRVFYLYSTYVPAEVVELECCSYLKIHSARSLARARVLVDTFTVDCLANIARGFATSTNSVSLPPSPETMGTPPFDEYPPPKRQQIGEQPRMDALSILMNLANQQRGTTFSSSSSTPEVLIALLRSRATMSFVETISEAQRMIAFWAQPATSESSSGGVVGGGGAGGSGGSQQKPKMDLSTDLITLMDALEVLGKAGEAGGVEGGLVSVAASACGCFRTEGEETPGQQLNQEEAMTIRQAHADIKDSLEWLSEAEEILEELNMAAVGDILSQAAELKRKYFESVTSLPGFGVGAGVSSTTSASKDKAPSSSSVGKRKASSKQEAAHNDDPAQANEKQTEGNKQTNRGKDAKVRRGQGRKREANEEDNRKADGQAAAPHSAEIDAHNKPLEEESKSEDKKRHEGHRGHNNRRKK